MIRNLTGIPFTLRRVTLAPEDSVPRVVMDYDYYFHGGQKITVISYKGIAGLPDPQPGVWLLVNIYVARLCWAASRRDVIALEQGELRNYFFASAIGGGGWREEDVATIKPNCLGGNVTHDNP